MKISVEEINRITGIILDAAVVVHKEMGSGLLESVYEYCLSKELTNRGIKIQAQFSVPLFYKGHALEKDFRLDMLVENEIIIEVKAVETILPVPAAQIISYLKITNKRVGVLINFNVPLLKNGFTRYVNNL